MRKWLPAVLILGTLAFSISAYSRLPERMVIHWNAAGEPDGYGSRAFGVFMLPAVLVGIWGLLVALPRLDPRRANIEQFRDTYDLLVIAVVAVLCVLQVGIVGSALGWPIQVGRLAPVSIGALILFLGTLLPRFKSNFFFGIRTPWTLSSETVWARTHQVGGYAVSLLGLLLVVAGIMGTHRWFLVAICGGMALVIGLLAYSYLLWRGEQSTGH
jgi:immunity protein, SdpI family